MANSEEWQRTFVEDFTELSERLEREDGSRGLRGIFKDQLSVGGGESFSAQEHRGREILELFQNAADKCRGDDNQAHGAVYIALTERGLVVANTGENFDFGEDEKRDALSIFGYTDKDASEVGKFGVGLTAIRATGEAYEVWTKANEDDQQLGKTDHWRVRCGPENILAPIATAVDSTADFEPIRKLTNELEAVTGRDCLLPDPSETPNELTFDLDADEFPYFLRPLPLQNWKTHMDRADNPSRLKRRADQLLSDKWGSTDDTTIPDKVVSTLAENGIDSFTTAVFVEYENEAWRDIFEQLNGPLSEPADPQELHDQAWFDSSRENSLTPELLLTLGEAETVVVESWLTDGPGSEFQIWDVEPAGGNEGFHRDIESAAVLETFNDDGEATEHTAVPETVPVELTEVRATLRDGFRAEAGTDTAHYEFWHVAFAEERTFDAIPWFDAATHSATDSDLAEAAIDAQLLVPQRGSERAYRPHLYYPISGLETKFWACLHGEFAVRQDRQSLDGNETMRNACVIAELARLTGCAAQVLADAEVVDNWLAARMPWRLLPASPDGDPMPPQDLVGERTHGEAAILDSLQAAMTTRLRTAKAIPAASGRRSVTDADASDPISLTGRMDVLAGLAAVYELDAVHGHSDGHLSSCGAQTAIDIPTESSMKTLVAWLSSTGEAMSEPDTASKTGTSEDWGRFDPDHVADGDTERLKRASYFLEPTSAQFTFDIWKFLLVDWADKYRARASDSDKTAFQVREPAGEAIINATMELATPDEASDPEAGTLNGLVPTDGPGPYLLPCAQSNDDPPGLAGASSSDEIVNLVYLEDHSGTSESSREVLRPDTDTTVEGVGGSTATTFNIFVLTEEMASEWEYEIKNVDWGTTTYDGPLAVFRSLLKSAAHAETPLNGDELRLFTERFDEIDDPPDTRPGAYHSNELVRAMVTAKNANNVDERFKSRLEARRTTLSTEFLTDSANRIGRDVQFDEACIDAHESLPAALTEIGLPPHAASTDFTRPIDGFDAEIGDTLPHTLSMLGVSLLPGIEVIARYRDIDLNAATSWSPLDTDSWGDPDADDDRVEALKNTLIGSSVRPPAYPDSFESPYSEIVTAPGFDPGTSIDHTSNCNMADYLSESEDEGGPVRVMLATWLWMKPDRLTRLSPSKLVPLLEHIGEDLAETVLTTAWTCDFGGGYPNGIEQPVPTLLSWQLRCLPGWNRVNDLSFSPPKPIDHGEVSGWKAPEQGWSLAYAVQSQGADDGSGQQSVALLPTVQPAENVDDDDSHGLSKQTLSGLGVKPIEELTAAEAAFRLQALLRGNAELRDSEAAVLFGGETPLGWKTLCQDLLTPIVKAVADIGRTILELFPYLTHLPVRGPDGDSDAWFALPVKDVADSAVYYKTEAKNWETRIKNLVPDKEYLLEGAPASTRLDGFKRFAEVHDANCEQVQYPRISHSVTTQEASELREILGKFDYKANILAAAQGRDAESYEQNEIKYDTAVDLLRIPETKEDVEFNGRTWAYQPLGDDVNVDRGLSIKSNSESDSSGIQVRPVIEPNIQNDEKLPALSEFFEALFRGGRSDSYKLALTGQNVDGVEEARRHLASTSHQELRTDLVQVASLLDVDVTVSFEDVDAGLYDTLRSVCRNVLHPTERSSMDDHADVPPDLREVVQAITEQTDAKPHVRAFGADWLTTHSRPKLLHDYLQDPIGDPTGEWKSGMLQQVDRSSLRLERFLPSDQRRVRRFCGLLKAVASETKVGTVPEPVSFRWYGQARLDIEGEIPSALEEVALDPDTWFELAWLAYNDSDQVTPDVIGSDLYTAFVTALADHIASDDEDARTAVKDKVKQVIAEPRQTSDATSDTQDSELYDQLNGTLAEAAGGLNSLSALADSESISASRRSDDPDNPRDNTTNAPRVAELLVLKTVYQQLIQSELTPTDVERAKRALSEDEHQWHYDSTWNSLGRPPTDSFPSLSDVNAADETYLHAFCDMAGEPIIGFDVLDLTGDRVPVDAPALDVAGAAPIETDAYPAGINPVPVEVKCVSAPSKPRFRFTTNQARRALRFVSSEPGTGPQRPFLLQFIQLTESEDQYTCADASVRVLAQPADIYELLGVDPGAGEAAVEELLKELVRSGHFQIT